MLQLEFLSEDSEEIALAERYWDIKPDGKFTYTVNSLLPFRQITTTGQLTTLLRKVVIVRDTNQQCPKCDELDIITTRSQYKPRAGAMYHPCSRCKEAAELAERAAKESSARALSQKLEDLTKLKLATRVDFDMFPDDVALLLLALDHAISPRLAEGTFTQRDCRFIAPTNNGSFLDVLIDSGALIIRPDLSPAGTFTDSDKGVRYYPSRAVYQLTLSSSGASRGDVIDRLRQRDFGKSNTLTKLWLDLATAECMRYLHDQCELHNLPIDDELVPQISSAIRIATELYSVAELWNVIWKIVRDAATLARRDYYNPAKAAATLPGKFKRLLEKVLKGEATLKSWQRPEHQPSGTLGELFMEIFGIDEQTPGVEAMDILSPAPAGIGPELQGSELNYSYANTLFLAATGHGVPLQVLDSFAEAITKGFSTSEAISYVYEAHPYLNDPY